MPTLTRGIAATAAILLMGTLIPAAQADPVQPPKPYVSCPTNAKVDSILGGVTKSSTRQAHGCWYVRDTGRVEFEFVADELAPARDGSVPEVERIRAGRIIIAAQACGIARAALDTAVELSFAREVNPGFVVAATQAWSRCLIDGDTNF